MSKSSTDCSSPTVPRQPPAPRRPSSKGKPAASLPIGSAPPSATTPADLLGLLAALAALLVTWQTKITSAPALALVASLQALLGRAQGTPALAPSRSTVPGGEASALAQLAADLRALAALYSPDSPRETLNLSAVVFALKQIAGILETRSPEQEITALHSAPPCQPMVALMLPQQHRSHVRAFPRPSADVDRVLADLDEVAERWRGHARTPEARDLLARLDALLAPT